MSQSRMELEELFNILSPGALALVKEQLLTRRLEVRVETNPEVIRIDDVLAALDDVYRDKTLG